MYLFYFFFEYKNVELCIIQSYHPLSNIIGKPVSKDLSYWYCMYRKYEATLAFI